MMKLVPTNRKHLTVFLLLPDIYPQVWQFSSPLTASVFGYILLNVSSSFFFETNAKKLYQKRKKGFVNTHIIIFTFFSHKLILES